jgi:5-methylcytosine-specific restriction endonuclease McrA
MAIPGHTNGRGSRWIKLRREMIAEHGKCASCGVTEKLSVHHMIPWRLTHDNRPENLVVLCRPCHAREDRLWEADLIAAAADFLLARISIRKRIFGENEP